MSFHSDTAQLVIYALWFERAGTLARRMQKKFRRKAGQTTSSFATFRHVFLFSCTSRRVFFLPSRRTDWPQLHGVTATDLIECNDWQGGAGSDVQISHMHEGVMLGLTGEVSQ